MADLHSFRTALIKAIQLIKVQRADARLHLLYSPESTDPLGLVDDARRETALIPPPPPAQAHETPTGQQHPRLITLDCARVPGYPTTTDSSLDDPVFESSIARAHAEFAMAKRPSPVLEYDDPEVTRFSVGGWIVSPESASAIAARIHDYSDLPTVDGRRERVRWTDPVQLRALWPTMTDRQRKALLGSAVLLAFGVSGRLRPYAAGVVPPPSQPGQSTASQDPSSLDIDQALTVRNIPLIRGLLSRWQSLCEEHGIHPPDDAERRLHGLIQAAGDRGLDSDSLTIYVLTAVELKCGATQDSEWLEMVEASVRDGAPLRDLIQQLSDDFWSRWSPVHSDAPGRSK